MADVLLASLVGSIRGMTESLFGWARKRRMLPVKCRCHRAKQCVDDGCRIRTRGIALLNVRMNERRIRKSGKVFVVQDGLDVYLTDQGGTADVLPSYIRN